MRNLYWSLAAAILFGFAILPGLAQNKPANRPPVIKHEAITTAVKGQSISIRAVVTSQSKSIKSVILFYTPSRDVAPFKIAMQEAGAGSYFGAIPSSLIKGINEFSYYIEAMDENDLVTETPWHTVKLQVPQMSVAPPIQSPPPAVVTQPVAVKNVPVARQIEPPRKSWSWKKPAIIAGSAAAIAGGALLVANSGGGGHSSTPSDGGTVTNAGTYAGTATRYLQWAGGSTSNESYSISIAVSSSGVVSSDNLHPDQSMQSSLIGNDFLMKATISESNLIGQVNYIGRLLSGEIHGDIIGSVTTTGGTNGTYSGTFSATKQ